MRSAAGFAGLFTARDGDPDTYDAEDLGISVRPYWIPEATEGVPNHIQNLPPRTDPYPMALRISLLGGPPRVNISIASTHVQGDNFTGILCDLFEDTQTLAGTDDVNVLVNDVVAGSGDPRFTVTTLQEDGEWFVKGAICSDITPPGGEECGGPGDGQLCNFHGLVNIKFTMDAYELPLE